MLDHGDHFAVADDIRRRSAGPLPKVHRTTADVDLRIAAHGVRESQLGVAEDRRQVVAESAWVTIGVSTVVGPAALTATSAKNSGVLEPTRYSPIRRRPVLPVHDSFITPVCHAGQTAEIMEACFASRFPQSGTCRGRIKSPPKSHFERRDAA